jgi:hypothetical protein
MLTDLNLISSEYSLAFILNDKMGGYASCILPRFEAPLFFNALDDFMSSESKDVKHSFETPSIKGNLFNFQGFIILEAESKLDMSSFKMMFDENTFKRLYFLLYPEYERSESVFGEPPERPFSWMIYNNSPEF